MVRKSCTREAPGRRALPTVTAAGSCEAHVLSPKLYRFLAPVRRVLRRGNSISRGEPGKTLPHVFSVTNSFFLSLDIQNIQVPQTTLPDAPRAPGRARQNDSSRSTCPWRRATHRPGRVGHEWLFVRAYKSLAAGRHRAAGCTGTIWSALPLFISVTLPFNDRASLSPTSYPPTDDIACLVVRPPSELRDS